MPTMPTGRPVSEFLGSVANPVRRADAESLVSLMSELSGQPAVMWGSSIVGFGHLHYRYASGTEGDMPAISFSPRATKLVLYVLTHEAEDDPLLAQLGKHSTGRMCLNITKLADVDAGVLRQVVERAWRERTAEH